MTTLKTDILRFRHPLPFCPKDAEVIYAEGTYNPAINQFIQNNYSQLASAFQESRHRFCYIPRIAEEISNEDFIRYYTPYIKKADGILPDSTFLNGIYKENGYHLPEPSLIIYDDENSGSNFYTFKSITLPDGGQSLYSIASAMLDTFKCEQENGRIPFMDARTADLEDFYDSQEHDVNYADLHFDAEVTNIMQDVREKIEQLRQYGISEMVLKSLLKPQIKLSRMQITETGHIFLPDYDYKEIKMTPLVKAVYFLFLRHPEGILFKTLPDYKEELSDIYSKLSGRSSDEAIRQSIDDLTNPCSNSINEKCARIREAFIREFDDSLARYYYVTGNRATAKSVKLPHHLIDWQSFKSIDLKTTKPDTTINNTPMLIINDKDNDKSAEELMGFTCISAKDEAIDGFATVTRLSYEKVKQDETKPFKVIDVIKDVDNQLTTEFRDEICIPFVKENRENPKDNNMKILIDLYDNTIDLINANNKKIRELKSKKAPAKEVNAIILENRQLHKRLYNYGYQLMTKYGNTRQKNYANALEQSKLNPRYWYERVITSSKLINIANEFTETLKSEELENTNFLDDNDYTNDKADDTNESSKSWENKVAASFDKLVSADMKLYFSTLFALDSKGKVGNTNYNYSRGEYVGMRKTMGANFIIKMLSTRCNFTSINDLYQSICELSQTTPECYGFIQIANRMAKDDAFANELFTQLNNPLITKIQITLTENGYYYRQSNRRSSTMGQFMFDTLNYIRSTIFTFYDETDYNTINNALNRLQLYNNENVTDEVKEETIKAIYTVLRKYYPKITRTLIENYVFKDNNIKDNLDSLAATVRAITMDSAKLVREYNKLKDDYQEKNKEYKKKQRESITWGSKSSTEPKPYLDVTLLNYNGITNDIASLANKLLPFSKVDIEINSANAEGNMASDLIDNNYITNLIKQIQYRNEEDANAGLQKLLDEVQKGEQYKYTPLFWGIKNAKGDYIQEGLFIRDEQGNVSINPNAKHVLRPIFFDGVKQSNFSKSVMYDGMSKVDYFMTVMTAFNSNINEYGRGGYGGKYAGYLMRTPSGAPKNFIIQARNLSTTKLFTVDAISRTNYLTEKQNKLNNLINKNGKERANHLETFLDIVNEFGSKRFRGNTLKLEDFYHIINGDTTRLNYTNMFRRFNKETGEVEIPIVYANGESLTFAWIKGKRVVGETLDTLYNIQVNDVYSFDLSDIFDPSTQLSTGFYADIADIVEQEGLDNGQIETKVNTDEEIFLGIKQNFINELNTFIDQLNNLFELDKNGKWVLRKDNPDLIDKVHKNGDIIKDGKLSGNFFKFFKLFETSTFETQKVIEQMLSLYGGVQEGRNGGLIHVSGTTATINEKNKLLVPGEQSNGKLVLNKDDKEVDAIINDIVSQWLTSYNKELIALEQEYKSIMRENGMPHYRFIEMALNYANIYMSFDDVFEGDVKFYGDARTFLKRAKEVQAGGKSYAGFDFNDSFSDKIHDTKGINGKELPISIGNGISLDEYTKLYSPVGGEIVDHPSANHRNGFRAITIKNTVRPSKYARRIQKEIFDILKTQMSEEQATKIAAQIYRGYNESTKTNDAQSYITIEEFIRRRFADGTINQYKDLLHQLYLLRKGEIKKEDIDLAKINARIQVQKNFYFDKKFDSRTKTFYPRQIKNAEFVLIPELLEGTQLKDLYDFMYRYDIGQVNTAETAKAAKRRILTFWDNDGNINPNFENDLKSDSESAIEDFYYKYLYKQQDVKDHVKDQANKFGTQLAKKIIDNANESVAKDIDNYFKAYSSNIRNNFYKLLHNMGWKITDDGKVVNTDGSDILNFNEFYERARHEAQRLGLDDNFIEYLTPDNLGNPAMPNYMNNVTSKLESIAQAIFNRSITRQTLPGWHCAQVTQIGHGMKVLDSNGKLRELKYHPAIITNNETGETIEEEVYNKLTEEEQKNYTVKAQAYSEVMLPRWSNLIPKDYSVEKLEQEGLDLQLSYRIPTEGKQSVSVIKVVGFLDDSYGSTIMMPDEWVTQTGSGFGGDITYGICFCLYKDKDNTIKKIKPNFDKSTEATRKRYNNYIKRTIDEITTDDINELEAVKTKRQQAKERLNVLKKEEEGNAFAEITNKSNVIFRKLPKDYKTAIKNINSQYKDKDKLLDKYNAVADFVETLYNSEENEETKANLKEFSEHYRALYNIVAKTKENATEFKLTSKELVDLNNKFTELYDKAIDQSAKENGLPSFEEFAEWDLIDQQSQEARDNIILESLINIMYSNSSREENYSRSNYDDITAASKEMSDALGISASKTSTYNVFTQINYFENAMSGASLKAFSVNRDTFNSLNNRAKSVLGNNVSYVVEYDLTDGNYDIDAIMNAYGLYDDKTKTGDVILIDKNGNRTNNMLNAVVARVRHNRLANSNNNRNVVGKLLTVYSSETTAHILDAIKEGSIYNENKFTFGSFKTLIDLGIDYRTAIAFLMQPAITTINKAHNEIDSIYSNNYGNAVQTAIKELTAKLGITIGNKTIDKYTNFNKVIARLQSEQAFVEAFHELFGVDIRKFKDINELSIALNAKTLKTRLESGKIINNSEKYDANKDYYDTVFDIGIALTFNNLYNTTKNIESIMHCSNPDKFGAKQTIRATRNVVNNIIEYTTKKNNPITNSILVDGKPFLTKLYPRNENGEIIPNKSFYPYLAAYLKYSTLPSIKVNSQLFPTESDLYNKVVSFVEQRLGIRFNDKQYREFKQYMMSEIYETVPFLTNPLTVTDEGFIVENEEEKNRQAINNKNYWKKEVSRIYGYELDVPYLNIEDVNYPTIEEIKAFNKLSPAQKVLFIQTNFDDNGKGIFNYLNVNLYNTDDIERKGYSQHYIQFLDDIDNMNEVYKNFKEAFFNTNPLIRLAAIDVIKYAFIVEGFRFKYRGISKIIANETIYKNIEDFGMNIVPVIRELFSKYSDPKIYAESSFIDKFIRSHSEYAKPCNLSTRANIENGNNQKFLNYSQGDGLVFIPFEDNASSLLDQLNMKNWDRDNFEIPYDYVKITRQSDKSKITTLYKMDQSINGIYLIPLNLLETNETGNYSVNENNNKYNTKSYYDAIIEYASKYGYDSVSNYLKAAENKETINSLREQYAVPNFNFENSDASDIDLLKNVYYNTDSDVQRAEIEYLFNDIEAYWKSPVEERGKYQVVRNNSRFLRENFAKGKSRIQNVIVGDTTINVKITKVTTSKKFNQEFFVRRTTDTNVPLEERYAYRNVLNAGVRNLTYENFYKIELVNNEEVKKDVEEQNKEYNENAEKFMDARTADLESL